MTTGRKSCSTHEIRCCFPGYEHAKSRHLFRDFVDASGKVTVGESEIVIRYQKRAHNPLLVAARFDRTETVIPWLGGKRLQLVFG